MNEISFYKFFMVHYDSQIFLGFVFFFFFFFFWGGGGGSIYVPGWTSPVSRTQLYWVRACVFACQVNLHEFCRLKFLFDFFFIFHLSKHFCQEYHQCPTVWIEIRPDVISGIFKQ